MAEKEHTVLDLDGHEVRFTSPSKVYFPKDLRLDIVPDRLKEVGDPSEGLDASVASLDALLDLAARDEAEGLGDAPWPPHFPKQKGELRRVQPSKAKKS